MRGAPGTLQPAAANPLVPCTMLVRGIARQLRSYVLEHWQQLAAEASDNARQKMYQEYFELHK